MQCQWFFCFFSCQGLFLRFFTSGPKPFFTLFFHINKIFIHKLSWKMTYQPSKIRDRHYRRENVLYQWYQPISAVSFLSRLSISGQSYICKINFAITINSLVRQGVLNLCCIQKNKTLGIEVNTKGLAFWWIFAKKKETSWQE